MFEVRRLSWIIVLTALFIVILTVLIPFLDGNRIRNESTASVAQESVQEPGQLVNIRPSSGMVAIDERQFIVTSPDAALIVTNETEIAVKLTVEISVINTACGESISMTGYWLARPLLAMQLATGEIETRTTFIIDVDSQGYNLLPFQFDSNPCTIPNENGVVFGQIRVDSVSISTKTFGRNISPSP